MIQVALKDLHTAVGKYICVDIKDRKQVCLLKKVDMEKNIIYWQQYGGSDNGKLFKSKFNNYAEIMIDVYEEQEAIVAVLEH